MGKSIELNMSNFDSTVAEGVTIVDFWAPWCGPCRMVAPVIEELAAEYEGRAKICKVNTDENQEVAVKYGIRSIPTIMVFKDGEQKDIIIGAASKKDFADKLEAHLS